MFITNCVLNENTVRTKRHSTNYYGLWHKVELPICVIAEKPQFSEGSKTKIYDEKGNVIYDAEKQSTINRFVVLKENLNNAIRLLHDNGIQITRTIDLSTNLPLICPICNMEGNPVFQLDKRLRNQTWIKRDTPIRLYYYHNRDKHYGGTWKNGTIKWSPKVTDIRKTMPIPSLKDHGLIP